MYKHAHRALLVRTIIANSHEEVTCKNVSFVQWRCYQLIAVRLSWVPQHEEDVHCSYFCHLMIRTKQPQHLQVVYMYMHGIAYQHVLFKHSNLWLQ
jgi:hypothetical protein